jgi:hypothetical protein
MTAVTDRRVWIGGTVVPATNINGMLQQWGQA